MVAITNFASSCCVYRVVLECLRFAALNHSDFDWDDKQNGDEEATLLSCVRGDEHHGEPFGHHPWSTNTSHICWQIICLPTCKLDVLGQLGHIVGIRFILELAELIAEGISNWAEDADNFGGVVDILGIYLDHLKLIHLLDLLVHLSKLIFIHLEGWAGAFSHLSDESVSFRLASTLIDELNIATLRLEDSTDCEKTFEVVSIDQLFAAKDIDKVVYL